MKKVNLQEGNDALKRALLLMNYDLNKTLSENKKEVSVLEEQSMSQIAKSAVAGATTGAIAGAPFAGIGAVPGAIVGALAGAVMGAINNPKMEQAEKMFQACKTEKSKPTLPTDELDSIADEINAAIEGLGTDEDAIAEALKRIPTIPDLCGLITVYGQIHGDLFDDLDGDLDDDTEWKNYVILPLRSAIKKNQEITTASQKNQTTDDKEKIDW